ncbi:putative bifunctional diguanylate cyclase/phosphodiesterase [Piscinibacter sakaiensis]|uniref:putative bifunctional diguanylate cyclase/phosphodiesterase n=1 Tax=Piscinibacter sakaiensis TaxID=1547922 RepID=UPI003AAF1C2A
MKTDIWADTQPGEPSDLMGLNASARSPLLDAKVMMVDDEPLMTELVQAYLEEEGYANFVVSNDPRNAMELLHSERPRVLLLDLMMPNLSGFEVLELIRAEREFRYLPVIVLTASTDAKSRLRALQLGATDFLSKPVDPSELGLRLRNTLAFHEYHNRMINFDAVTGLPNARMFDPGIDEMLKRRDQTDGMVVHFSITVPECKQLRESFGPEMADQLARSIAGRLDRFALHESPSGSWATAVERAPRVARLGGEQFGLALESMLRIESVEPIAKRLISTISEPLVINGHEVAPSASFGIAVAPTDGKAAVELRKNADLAASAAAQTGPGHYRFASADLNAKSIERVTLGSQLRGAAARGELVLHYQPKVDLVTGRVTGAEALVRWQHPEFGLVPPLQFIPLAEELGLISNIGQWVMERACADAASWMRDGLGELKVAINVAKLQFASGNLRANLRHAMHAAGLPPRQLVVELTESMLMDDADAGLAQMHELKALGLTLSIDDFGTGYSSLSYLKNFPLDELKIDRSFIKDLPGQLADKAIVSTIVKLGQSLGMSVTAEGVETDGQQNCLRSLGCDTFQGYLFSKPLPNQLFIALVRERSPLLVTEDIDV